MSVASLATRLAKPILPLLHHLPTPILSLPPVLALHIASHPSPSPLSLLSDPLSHPLHLPIIVTAISIPLIYALGHISGNVSWVDRAWPFYTPLCSAMTLLWLAYNPTAPSFAHNIPRLALMFALQIIWSIRLTSNAIRRGFYDLSGEDYRYTVVRKIVPRWMWSLIHLLVIALAQPLLLLALSLPLYAVLSFPPAELSSGLLSLYIPLGAFQHLGILTSSSAPTSTPALTLTDLLIAIFALSCVWVEYKVDNAMFAYHTSKSAAAADPSVKMVQPTHTNPPTWPQPTAYPASHHPGFPVHSWWKYSRHANFAGEQLCWLSQALFPAAAARPSGVTLAGIPGGTGGIWGPPLAVSVDQRRLVRSKCGD